MNNSKPGPRPDASMRVGQALKAYHQQANDRGDEAYLHVADLVKCPREVWARRNGAALLGYTTETRRKFRVGLDLEREVVDAVEHHYGGEYAIHRGVLCWLDLAPNGGLIGGVCNDDQEAEEMMSAHPNRVIGHPDVLALPKASGLPRVVIEVKSTLFYERTGPDGRKARMADDQPQHHYVIQTSSYGLACAAEVAIISVSCVSSGHHSPENSAYRYHPERDRELITMLVSKYQRVTALGTVEPPAVPPDYSRRMRPKPDQASHWLCDFCRLATCEKNNNPQRLEVSLESV